MARGRDTLTLSHPTIEDNAPVTTAQQSILAHQSELQRCTRCENMIGPVVTCRAVVSRLILIGQAPGDREGPAGKPFAWTAGRTLFKWFESIGLSEEAFRNQVYIAAVCRCFPGKNPKGGDRVPTKQEIKNCSTWFQHELLLQRPELILPVGKLAIEQFMTVKRLTDVIGNVHRLERDGLAFDLIPLPHSSGLSTWFKTEPGKTLLQQALGLIAEHPVWKNLS